MQEKNNTADYSRGCPYKCPFCASQLMFPGGVVWRQPSEVVRELEELSSKFETNLVFFPDLTFIYRATMFLQIRWRKPLLINKDGIFRSDNGHKFIRICLNYYARCRINNCL